MINYHRFGFIKLTEKHVPQQNRYWDLDDVDTVFDVDDSENVEILIRCNDISIIGEVIFPGASTMWFVRLKGDNKARLVEEGQSEILAEIEKVHPDLR